MLRKLPEKGTIGVIAPAFPADQEKTQKGIDYLKAKGFNIVEGKSLTARHWYFAGNDALRVEDLHRMFTDPEVDAIFCARGGWGTLRLLDQLDYDLIARNPKMLVGYSDITTLHLAIWHKTRVPGMSGPMVAVEMAGNMLPFTAEHFWGQVFNDRPWYEFSFGTEVESVKNPGRVESVLIGGCLSMVAHQLGTPYMPELNGAILFLEDVGEPPYKIDRYLAQLKQAGIFDEIAGLILGQFLDCEDDNPTRKQVKLETILQDYFKEATYPVVFGFPYGHGMRKFTMPIGVKAVLDTDQKLLKIQNPFMG